MAADVHRGCRRPALLLPLRPMTQQRNCTKAAGFQARSRFHQVFACFLSSYSIEGLLLSPRRQKEQSSLTQSRTRSTAWRRTALILLAAVLCAGAVPKPGYPRADNPPSPDTVGTIVGDSISVQGPMTVDATDGQFRTILRSGSNVQVKSGQAHIDLVEGGNITICGPSRFSVLKSAGALMIALDSGTIRAHVEGQPTLTIYTAQIQAHPISIGGGPEDTLVGLDAAGTICIRANRGAVRIEQQLTGQSLLIPQAGDVSIANGQLETLQTTAGRCTCELQLTAKPPAVVTEISALASTEELRKKTAAPKAEAPADPPAATTAEPIYQVFMPPLQYDARARAQQEYDPKLIVVVRRARVRPTLIFQGKVEGEAIVAQAAPPPAPPKIEEAKKPEEATTWNRVRTFFHKLWSPSS